MSNSYIVTGVSSGLGASVSNALKSSGFTVVGIDWRGSPDIKADLSKEVEAQRAMEMAISLCPNPSGVVSNAGLSPVHESRNEIIDVNWFSAKFVLDFSLEYLAAEGGSSAVAISSIGAAVGGDPILEDYLHSDDRESALNYLEDLHASDPNSSGIIAYSSCKAAIARYVRRNAQFWGNRGVRLNAIAPGKMYTSMLDGLLADPVLSPGVVNLPKGVEETGHPDQVSEVVQFLLSAKSSFVHGQIIYVDGGTEAIMRPDIV